MQTLFTLGYADPNSSALLEQYMQDPQMVLVDVRLSPRSRWQPQWNNHALATRWGSRYVHIPELGNLNYKSSGIILKDEKAGLAVLRPLLEAGHQLVLLCACKYPETCHRTVVAAGARALLLEKSMSPFEARARVRMNLMKLEQAGRLQEAVQNPGEVAYQMTHTDHAIAYEVTQDTPYGGDRMGRITRLVMEETATLMASVR